VEVVADFVDGEAFGFEEVAGGGEGVCANEALVSPDEIPHSKLASKMHAL